MRLILLFIYFIILAETVTNASESSYEKGKDLYFQNGCGNCHGTNAEGSSYYPRLADKKQNFLIQKLKNFKNGIAATQKQEIMFTFAKSLTYQQIQEITDYLSHFKAENAKRYDVEEDLLGVDY